MARIPTLDTLGAAPTPESVRPTGGFRAGVAEQGDMAVAQAFSSLGDALFKGGEKIADAQGQVSYANAQQQFLDQKLKADRAALDDPDYETVGQRYQDSVTKSANDLAATLPNPTIRREFLASTSRLINFSSDTVFRAAHAKRIDAGKAATLDGINGGVEQALQANDEATRAAALDAVGAKIDAAVSSQFISAADAAKLRKSIPEQFAERRARMLIDLDPNAALKLLAPEGGDAAPGLTPKPSKRVSISGPLGGAIDDAAKRNGVDPDTLTRIALTESGGQPATNPASGAAGPFQFMPATAQQYGVADPNDPAQAANGAAALLRDNAASLRTSLGREPTAAELYLAHQQGAGGAAALLSQPDRPAVDVLADQYGDARKARAAVLQNGGSADMKAGDFAKTVQQRFEATAEKGTISDAPGIQPASALSGAAPQARDVVFPRSGDWRDFFSDPSKRMDLARQAKMRADQVNAANDVAQAAQERAAERAQKAKAEAAAGSIVSQLIKDPSQVDPVRDIANNGDIPAAEKWSLFKMVETTTGRARKGPEEVAEDRIMRDLYGDNPTVTTRAIANDPDLGPAAKQRMLSELDRAQKRTASGIDPEAREEDRVLRDIYGPFPTVTEQQIAENNDLGPAAKMRMLGVLARASKGGDDDRDAKTYGSGFYDLYQRTHLAAGDPNRITDPAQLYPMVQGDGRLTVAGVDKLRNEILSRRTPEGEAFAEMQKAFFANAKGQLSGANDALHLKDPKGEEQFLKFMALAFPAIEAGKKDGKSAADLFNPDSKDYVGRPLGQLVRTPQQKMADMMAANDPGEKPGEPPPDLTTDTGIADAFRRRKITKEQAEAAAARLPDMIPPPRPSVPLR